MVGPRGFPSWDELYLNDTIERLPWYTPALDPDLAAALDQYALRSGRLLDQGTGPGTQAIALAQRGFDVTGSDLSPAALAYATRSAKARSASVTFVQDDVLASKLIGPFDIVFDRGCFHVLAPERRADYVAAIHRLLRAGRFSVLEDVQPPSTGDRRAAQIQA